MDVERLLPLALQVLPQASGAEQWATVKTWIKGWTTSRRFNERERLPCMLGCALGADDLVHYATCSSLLAVVTVIG